MGDHSAIEWTQATWNPLVGCSRVSEGCRYCYAERQAYRAAAMGISRYDGITKKVGDEIRWTGKVALVESALELPLKWKKPRRIFVNSMSDLFHESVPDEWIERIFLVMIEAEQHTYQVLTKRPRRMRDWVTQFLAPALLPAILERIWLGVSVEDQATADERIPLLLQTQAAVRFVSLEPCLEAVDLTRWLGGGTAHDGLRAGVLGTVGDRRVLGGQGGRDLASPANDRREPNRSAALRGPAAGATPCGDERVGRLPEDHVHGGRAADGGLRSSDRVDGGQSGGHPGGHGSEPRGRQPGESAPEQPRADDAIRQRDPRHPGPRQETDGAGRREELERETDRGAGQRDPSDVRGSHDGSDSDRAGIRRDAADGVGHPPAEDLEAPRLDWVIIGGESGPGARPFDLAWARQTIAQGRAADVPVFVKQMGRWVLGDHTGFRVNHWLMRYGRGFVPPIIGRFAHERPEWAVGFSTWNLKGGDPAEWPEDLRVREYPK